MAKTGLALAATVAACLLVVRCGGADGPPPSASPPTTDAPTRAGAQPAVVVQRDNPCSVLLPSEVGEILGVPISLREVADESTCHFVYDKPSPEGPPHIALTVHFTGGKAALMATRAAGTLFSGDGGFERLGGIGDEAWLGPGSSVLVFVKGDAGAELDLRLVPNGREKGTRLATLIASRL